MQTTDSTARRTVARVEDKIHFGADSQVDDRNVVITPMNPALTDPFLLLSEDWFSTPGFEWHPHRGLETVTLVLDGVLEHGDNLGNAGALSTGDIQWMTAGRGIIHRELAFRNERAHTLQLWVNLPARLKMAGTRYQDLRAADRPVIDHDGARIDLISGDADGTCRAGAEQLADLRDLDHPGAQPQPRTPAARPRPRLLLRPVRRGDRRRPRRQGRADRLVRPRAAGYCVGDHPDDRRRGPVECGHGLQRPANRPAGRDGRAVRDEHKDTDHAGVQRLPLRQVRQHPPAGPPEVPLTGANGPGSRAG